MLSLYRLPNKIKDEEIVKVIRRDFFVLFLKIMFFVLLLLLPLIFFSLVIFFENDFMTQALSAPLLVLGTSAYYLFAWLFFFFSFIDYYLDIWIITSERIIDIQQKGFFSRVISEQKLFRIQDVTSEVHGVVATMLKYGNVHVQTAGTKERFFFHEVPHPDDVRDTIIRLVKLNQKKHKREMQGEGERLGVETRENEAVDSLMKH